MSLNRCHGCGWQRWSIMRTRWSAIACILSSSFRDEGLKVHRFQQLLILREHFVPAASPHLLGKTLIVSPKVRIGGSGQTSIEPPERGIMPTAPGFFLEDDLGGSLDAVMADALVLKPSADEP